MKIIKAEYLVSAVNSRQYPQSSKPEIALVGRSNVGKSSFINKFVNRKNLARTSSVPGKTQSINFYLINDAWFFVDLPGYGYAQVSKEKQAEWGRFINEYLYNRQQLVGIIQLVDIRHAPSQDDLVMQEWLVKSGIPFLVVATKGDKIARGKWSQQLKIIKDSFNLTLADSVIAFSTQSGAGLAEIAAWVENLVNNPNLQSYT